MIFVAADLKGAAERLFADHGLASLPGGKHIGHGTSNRIVPLGDSYLELMAVVDEKEARSSSLGRWALSRSGEALCPAAVCLRTDDIESVAASLGEEPEPMSRHNQDGSRLSWRLAGLGGMLAAGHPFFIQWDGDDHPGRLPAPHRLQPDGITGVAVGPVGPNIAQVLAPVPSVTVSGTEPGVKSVVIAAAEGEIRLG